MGFWSRHGKLVVAVVLMGATGGAGVSAVDDVLIYRHCSSKAMEKATKDARMIKALGEQIETGPWYEASLGVAPDRYSATCSFPVSGKEASGRLHLKAVRVEGGRSTLMYNVLGPGRWEVLMLEAMVPVSGSEGKNGILRRINLMQASDEPRPGDKGPLTEGAVQEV